jgi:hypothetical protein
MQAAIVVKKGGKFFAQVSGDGCWVKGLHPFKTKKAAQAFCDEFNRLERDRVALLPEDMR